ncbi:glycosyltransferase [Allomuricauda sp. d1]|uniref:glycosyltransferase n=1 Tax=Allomuricauda sp. d1 TaxID=3136725 RepID=UPI0031D14898
MDLQFSFIIPVYNRPEEIRELLESLLRMNYEGKYEIVIVEDGSSQPSDSVIGHYADQLSISYYQKKNTGPGDSRNFGMQRAKGNYFIVLDSDCLLPAHYLNEIEKALQNDFVHCFGGPDAAHPSFSNIQKAIDFTMTSFLTTGGIRGGSEKIGKFQPRSFNMGISKEVFEKTGGFGQIHPGEDPDLTFRIWEAGYQTRLFEKAYVYHKRRIDWGKFYKQVNKFGMVRPILNKWHPQTSKLTYWFPTLFLMGFVGSCILMLFGFYWPMLLYGAYFGAVLIASVFKTKSVTIAFLSLFSTAIQFFGYGRGFLKSTILVNFSGKEPEQLFPQLFFKR